MWLLRRLMCLIRDHVFAAVKVKDDAYQYCLRCGTVETVKVHSHNLR